MDIDLATASHIDLKILTISMNAFVPFAPEICERIFAYACTDDGRTGRSLSEVSRLVHNTSKTFKYYTIAIHGPAQAAGFLELMQSFPPDLRNISHLFVSNRRSPLTLDDIGPDINDRKRGSVMSILRAIPSRLLKLIPETKQQRNWKKVMEAAQEYARRSSRLDTLSREQDDHMLRMLLRILDILAPGLQTLSVFFDSNSLSLPFWEGNWQPVFPSLPALTELTITYRGEAYAEWSQWRVLSGPASLPSLKRLDISGVEVQFYTPFHCYRCMSRRAPSLTHLCIPARMVGSMEAALMENRPDLEQDARGLLPPHLEHVFIQLPQHPTFICCGLGELHADSSVRCQSLSLTDERFDVLQVDGNGKKSRDAAKREWMDRISGFGGNWRVDDRIIGACR